MACGMTCSVLGADNVELSDFGKNVIDCDLPAHEFATHPVTDTYVTEYGNDFVYDRLSEDMQEVWNVTEHMCLEYLEGTMDIKKAVKVNSSLPERYGITYAVHSAELTREEMEELFVLFRNSNPQYYFLSYDGVFGADDSGSFMAYYVYPEFRDGDARAEATEDVLSEADRMALIVADYESDIDKVTAIQKLICNKVSYNVGYVGSRNSEEFEKDEYTQSAYSVLRTDIDEHESVCAGYSLAFEMVSNRAGVQAISVTSDAHQWNKVRADGHWYNVDLAYADRSEGVDYTFFMLSDSTYKKLGNAAAKRDHVVENFWHGLIPKCKTDLVWE